VKFAFQTYGNFILRYFRRNVDKILLGKFFGSQSLGLYDRAYQLSSMLASQIVLPLNNIALSSFSKLSGDRMRYKYSYLQMISIIAFIGMPLSVMMALISDDLILFLLGSNWVAVGKIFFVFSLSAGLSMIYFTYQWLHLSLGTASRLLRWSILESVVTILCFLVGLNFGALGVAIAFSASIYILILPAIWYAGRPIDLELLSILSAIWKYFVAAFIAGTLSYFILENFFFPILQNSQYSTIMRLLSSIIIFAMQYIILIVVLYRSTTPIVHFFMLLHQVISGKNSDRQTV